jgi:D-sedoheptulose 7-phosphate isomerase
MPSSIKDLISESIVAKQTMLDSPEILQCISNMVEAISDCFSNGGKLLFCGNGGSAADAQHLAAEFSGRFYINREPLFAEALHVNTSYLTAVANDFGYDEIFARMVRAMGKAGDILIGISTSGNSPNIVKAMNDAKSKGMITIAWVGSKNGMITENADIVFAAPSSVTPRIQECHMLVGHIVCQLVEAKLFS